VSDVFERLRGAGSAQDVKALYVEALATSARAGPRELGALRRGMRERLRQLERTGATAPEAPSPRAVRYGETLSRARALSLAPRRLPKKRTVLGGILGVLFLLVGVRAVIRLATGKATLPFSGRSAPEETGADRYHVDSLPRWRETVPRIDALLARRAPDREGAREILSDLGLTEARLALMVRRRRVGGRDLERLEGLHRALRARDGPPR
jgi:hypothetical protein